VAVPPPNRCAVDAGRSAGGRPPPSTCRPSPALWASRPGPFPLPPLGPSCHRPGGGGAPPSFLRGASPAFCFVWPTPSLRRRPPTTVPGEVGVGGGGLSSRTARLAMPLTDHRPTAAAPGRRGPIPCALYPLDPFLLSVFLRFHGRNPSPRPNRGHCPKREVATNGAGPFSPLSYMSPPNDSGGLEPPSREAGPRP